MQNQLLRHTAANGYALAFSQKISEVRNFGRLPQYYATLLPPTKCSTSWKAEHSALSCFCHDGQTTPFFHFAHSLADHQRPWTPRCAQPREQLSAIIPTTASLLGISVTERPSQSQPGDMAELAASIITIAHVVCVLFETGQKAIEYIDDVKTINGPINELLARVKDLQRLTKTVALTYQQAEPSVSSDSRSLRLVRKALVTCEKRLENLKPLAFELASLESKTWRHKLTIKRQLDRAKREIKTMVEGIQWDINLLNSGLTCLNVDLGLNRRSSEPLEEFRSTPVLAQLQSLSDRTVSPTSETLSDTETIFGPDPDLQLRRCSTTRSSSSRPSISSTSSHTPSRLYDPSDGAMSPTELTPLTSKNEWKDFDFHIKNCGGRQDRVQEIRDILARHSDGAALAKYTDTTDRTPLHVAAQRGDVDLGRILIDEYHADINAQDSKPCSVLELAVAGRNRSFVALLLERGVDENVVLTQNKRRFREMKRAIQHQKQTEMETASNVRTLRQSI
ncbi:hypothetical protein CC80DRAFT_502488 [Byssothecium circinans]|uniref:Uncharacterized protein n=1 Tax=Byssothecium circinans TaxID=147558 RepID=A0A6A5UEE0_9PLEO|nr:hypothetical protein CC80DRAFT_502488 [Byssothecium circinans]